MKPTAILLTALSALSLAAGPWDYKFPTPEENQAFFDAFRTKVIGQPPAPVDPAMTVDSVEKADGYEIRHISYNVDQGERLKAFLLVPDHKPGEKLPLVCCLHPTSGGGKNVMLNRYPTPAANAAEQLKRDNRANALELVKRGFVCFLPDRQGYGERAVIPGESDPVKNMKAAQEAFKAKYPGWHHTFGKVPTDLSRALDELLKLDFIDTANIGAIGHSLGGWDSLYLWGTDPRVKAAVVNSGGAHWIVNDMWLNQKWRLKFAEGTESVKPNTDCSAQVFIMMGAPKPLLYMRGIREAGTDYGSCPVNSVRLIREYYGRFGPNPYQINAKNQFATFFHDEGHDFPPFARQLAYSWLEQQLKKH